jgi:hypothetical protein
MFISRERPETELESAYDKALHALDNHQVDSDEYAKILGRVSELHKMKESEKPSTVSKDTQALIAANLAGILMIIAHERVNVITSKALSFVQRPR